jgi:exopolysaccharide biosynthesis polyprenyl glycosylphosphotransferase
MLKEKDRLLRNSLRIFDLILSVPAFYFAFHVHVTLIAPLFPSLFTGLFPVAYYTWILALTIPLGLILLHLGGLYDRLRLEPKRRTFWKILRVMALFIVALYLGVHVIVKATYFSRFFIFLYGFFYTALLLGFRFLILSFLERIRERGFNVHQTLIIGTGEGAREVHERIEAYRFWGLHLLGFIACSPPGVHIPREKIIGTLEDLEKILRSRVVDEVFVALSEEERPNREEILRACERVGVPVYLVPVRYEWQLSKSTTTSIGDLHLIRFSPVPDHPIPIGVKRGIDLVVSSLVLLVFPVLYLLVGFLIKLDSPGPILYRQIRISHNKRKFNCYKFRTMIHNADRQVHLLERMDETEGPIRKARNDPRITRVGRVLRRFSIDETPQFINIFKGEMSLVGPRPPTPDEVEQYEFDQLRRLSIKQGLTGLWQVSGRDAIKSFEERLRLDLYYIDHWSLWLDIRIIFKTFYIIFKGAS